MKYCVLIMDGAAGLPLPERNNQTCLELARTPNLDMLAQSGYLGLARTVPPGMEPGSAVACMSVLGYDPRVYYKGRAAIEARAMGIAIGEGEAVFRCNLVTVQDGKMRDYSAGHIPTQEAKELIAALQRELGSDEISFYPGVSYRHICKIKGQEETLKATCTPPHDIPGKPMADYLPEGDGSEILRDLMERSKTVLRDHPVNKARHSRGELPATQIWLFWGTGRLPPMPSFRQKYGVSAAMTSAVDLLRGLALMAGMDVLEIKGVTDGPDNNYAGQAAAALEALQKHDLVVIHVEAPDEAGHGGHIDEKIKAIENIDKEVVSRLRSYKDNNLRLLVMPDHPTPIKVRTHTAAPVPFLLWSAGFVSNGARRFTETEANNHGSNIEDGYKIMGKLAAGK
ncbi:MAG: cofactor-independent phosphoglycerate mutase [Dehalococcoidales bacterium]|nr:cofactor-independent phosphoglycerate mutase [Dehalococcoidales bacterium]